MWFLISLGVLVGCFALLIAANPYLNPGQRKKGAEAGPRPARLPQDASIWFLRYYTGVFKSQNLNTVASIMTDVLYHMVSSTIKGLNRLGIRKEMIVDPYPPKVEDEEDAADAVFTEGKTDVSHGTIYSRYTERYVDNMTDQVLYEKSYDKKMLNLNVTRSSARTAAEPISCLNCGADVDTSGELFICKHCGTTYRSDSYDWVLSSMDTLEFKTKGIMGIGIAAYAYAVLMFLPMLLGIFAGGRPVMIGIVVVLNILLVLGTIVLILFGAHANKGYAQMIAYDPLGSMTVMKRRVAYLMRRLYYAHDHNPADARAVLDPAFYQNFAAQHQHSGNYVLDLTQLELLDSRFYVQNGRQIFDANFWGQVVLLTPQRQIAFGMQKGKIVLYRNEQTRYEQMLHAQSFTCSGCGSSLNLTAQGACKYCGLEYDIANFDWKLAYVAPSVFA